MSASNVAFEGIRVFVPDPEHGEGEWPSHDAARPVAGPSAEFRKALEAEYKEEFSFTSIGTGAAVAAYFTTLMADPVGIAVSTWLAGKAIKDGFEAWNWVYEKLAKYFHRNPTFNREGAAILAYKAVVDRLEGLPKSYQLLGFSIQHRLACPDPCNPPQPEAPTVIAGPPRRVDNAMIYVFNIVADRRQFLVTVDGSRATILTEAGLN